MKLEPFDSSEKLNEQTMIYQRGATAEPAATTAQRPPRVQDKDVQADVRVLRFGDEVGVTVRDD